MATITEIFAEARALVDADSTSYPDATLLRRVNLAYEMVVAWLINADGTWNFDDTNYTDFPIGKFTLVEDQAKYSFNDEFLQIEEVQILNKNGDYEIIHPIDQKEYSNVIPLEEAYETSGMPQYYDKISDDTIKLFPAPDDGTNVTLADGIKIKFKRKASVFTSAEVATGTKVPGFASPFHYILSYMAARPYALSYKPDRVATLNALIGDTGQIPTGMKRDLLKHYGTRQKDVRKQAKMRGINFR